MDCLRYDHYDKVSTPIVVVGRSLKIIYKNKALSKIIPGLGAGSSFEGYLRDCKTEVDACIRSMKPAVAHTVSSDRSPELPVLLIPDYSPEGPAVIAVFAEFLYGYFSYYPSPIKETPKPKFRRTADLSSRDDLSGPAEILIAPLCHALSQRTGAASGSFCVGDACMLLNRYAERVLLPRGLSFKARCTADCAGVPVENFQTLCAAMVCFSALFTVNACDARASVTFFVESGFLSAQYTYFPILKKEPEKLWDAVPDRAAELKLLDAALQGAGYEERILSFDGMTILELRSRKELPAAYLKASRPGGADQASARVEALLDAFTLRLDSPWTEERP